MSSIFTRNGVWQIKQKVNGKWKHSSLKTRIEADARALKLKMDTCVTEMTTGEDKFAEIEMELGVILGNKDIVAGVKKLVKDVADLSLELAQIKAIQKKPFRNRFNLSTHEGLDEFERLLGHRELDRRLGKTSGCVCHDCMAIAVNRSSFELRNSKRNGTVHSV